MVRETKLTRSVKGKLMLGASDTSKRERRSDGTIRRFPATFCSKTCVFDAH